MTLSAFQQLDYKGRTAVTGRGVCIGGRADSEHIILLYQIESFYIEVYFHKKDHYITKFFGFDDMDLLDPYLEKINICIPY